MLYEDEFGILWRVDADNSLKLATAPDWPASDDEFLKLANIEPIGEIDENE